MTTVYFVIQDLTLSTGHPQQITFFAAPVMRDISGFPEQIAKRNKTPLARLRLYICPNKKTWEDLRTNKKSLENMINL